MTAKFSSTLFRSNFRSAATAANTGSNPPPAINTALESPA
ncbi:hypothetical protein GLE_0107 [Lysobacter enzymogenes]|uniref:Uncharacterized protein n=1 Tax=Lysobacter enzymogenes TaxID=69 RepID=A0A0S2DAA3_LYSEN|nr:hypothetical protein GLE_0107 [Lysobacter enzymogenes]